MKKQARGAFWLSFGISLSVLIFVLGIVFVDYQGRRLSFGDASPPVYAERRDDRTELKIKLLGAEHEMDITQIDKFWKLFLEFSCIPHG